MSDLKISVSSYPYLYALGALDALKRLHDLGYDCFELTIYPPHCWPAELTAHARDEVSHWLAGEGCSITSFVYPLEDNNPNSVDRIMRRYTLDRYRETIDLAAEWKCPYLLIFPGAVNELISPPIEWRIEWFLEGVNELVAHADGTGVQLLLENVPFTFLPTAQDIKDTVDRIGPKIGVNFDICNSAYIKEDVAGAIRLLGSLIRNVHNSDTGYDAFRHDRLGTGIVDPVEAAAALREVGFAGRTVIEIITDATNVENDPIGDIQASHDVLAQCGWTPPPSRSS